ncbi:MAG TPA: hypothetical protein VHV47_15220 [Opitutaceae bacterium]|nr:hypothetical protein [Opitutaceae bacterium]
MRRLPALLLLGALEAAALAPARGQPPASAGPVISLPPLLVETEGGPHWRYGEVPGLQVLTCCDDDKTQAFVDRNFHQQDLLNELVAPDLQMRTSAPLVLILYAQKYQAALSQEVIEEMNKMAPHEQGGIFNAPEATLLPHLRLTDPDSTEIYLLLQDNVAYASKFGHFREAPPSPEGDYDELAFSDDYVAMLLDGRTPELPPWFRAGLMQLYQDVRFSRSEVALLPLKWISGTDSFIPADQLFSPSVLPAAAADPGGIRARDWATEAELFIRWALDGPRNPHREPLWRFVRESSAAPATEEMFQRCFGFGYAEFPDILKKYLADAGHERDWEAAREPERPRLILHEATPSQIRQIKGDWGRRVLSIISREHPEMLASYVARARRTLLDAYNQGDRSPDLLASLGQLYFQTGDRFQARAYLESAVQAGVGRPMPYVLLAQLRLTNALAQSGGRLGPAELGSIIAPLTASRRLEPALAAGYLLLAAAWQHSAAPPSVADLAPLNEGARLFPRHRQLVLAVAALDVKAGDRTSAAGLVSLVLGSAPDGELRQDLLAFQAAYLAAPAPGRN